MDVSSARMRSAERAARIFVSFFTIVRFAVYLVPTAYRIRSIDLFVRSFHYSAENRDASLEISAASIVYVGGWWPGGVAERLDGREDRA